MVYKLTGPGISVSPQPIHLSITFASDFMWPSRAMKFMEDMNRNPSGIRVVKGVFRFNAITTCSIFTKLSYEAAGVGGERRYRVVSAAFSLNLL